MISLNNNKIPFFSVIICTFNRKKLISNAIASLINQSYEDWEAIIIDDGSSDNTFDSIQKYCNSDSRIRYMYHSNRGAGNSKNSGIIASSGLFITFLDSDDSYKVEHLNIRRESLLSNPDIDLMHGGVQIIGNKYVPDFDNPEKIIHLKDCVIGGTFFFRKNTALELGGFPSVRFGDDSIFYRKYRAAGKVIAKIENKTYIYNRESEDSLCNLLLNT